MMMMIARLYLLLSMVITATHASQALDNSECTYGNPTRLASGKEVVTGQAGRMNNCRFLISQNT